MNLTRWRLFFFLVSLPALVMLGSCSSQPRGAAGGKPKIAVVISTLNNPWFVVLADAARNRAAELGYDATVFDSQDDTNIEKTHFENIITGGFKAILFNPTNADGSVENARLAKNAGLPVFCIDREINSLDAATSQILSDSYPGCVAIGRYFVEKVGQEGKYAELLGLSGDNNTLTRSKGFHSVVDKYPGLKMVAQDSGDFNRAKAQEKMESILQAHGDINAVFCGNDAMALGAYQALRAAGKERQVKVFGFDGADEVVELIGQDKIAATGMQFPKDMARRAAEFADEWLKGKRDFEPKEMVAVELVTPENVSKYAGFGRKE
jgi:ABC-type sugar transport system substrate-binding protein